MEQERVKTVLIASGSGTDANSIMEAYNHGCISNIDIVGLISTKRDEGCIEKAKNHDIPDFVVDRRDYASLDLFNDALSEKLASLGVELVFLVGCIVKIYPVEGVDIYNIHPAQMHDHGGDGMYGLKVHKHVLNEIADQIARGRKTLSDRFFTHPTVHEAVLEYDAGASLLTGSVEIPQSIISDWLSAKTTFDEAAKKVQKIVLPYEWIMLPAAVKMAAKKILDRNNFQDN